MLFTYHAGHGVTTLIANGRRHQMDRIARLLIGRKCDITIKHTKTRSLIKIYQ